MRISGRAARIEPFYVMEVGKAAAQLAREAAGTERPVIALNIGEPDFTAPPLVQEAALRAVGAEFAYVNVFEDPEIREGLKQYSNWPTYPQLYVNGELIGGCDITLELYQSGELAEIIKQAKAAASESA